ncbi:MAG: succinate dehydrogenase, cytochrome b556 subunit [Gammaproteobacteria bacterium]|nr:MAG: succinate dehydrogenase, cytochrome b556 subunit [Gammaproteobacteria bacterium]
MANFERPLSPHLQIYKWPLAMAISILHRITGVALAIGAALMVAIFVAIAADPECYEWIQGILTNKVGKAFLFLWTFALFLHLFNGIRHLFWDAGYGFEKSTTTKSGVWVIIASFILTFAVWGAAYYCTNV